MTTIRPGSHMSRLMQVLSVAGEYPAGSLDILGDIRTVRAMVHKHKTLSQFSLPDANMPLATKLFQTSGAARLKTIRLCKGAIPLLDAVCPGATNYYMEVTGGHHFSGGSKRVERHHRVAEAVALCMMAGIEVRPYALPSLQKEEIRHIRLSGTALYPARYLKTLRLVEYNKFKYARTVGLLAYPGGAYAVYNTRNAAMKWKGKGERNSKADLSNIASWNFGLNGIDAALIMGNSADIALQTMRSATEQRHRDGRLEKIYGYLHFVPLNQSGIRLLELLTIPDWKEVMLDALFEPEDRPRGQTSVECDAIMGETLVFSHLDSDIARLVRLREAILHERIRYQIVCFPWQRGYLSRFLADTQEYVSFRELEMEAVIQAMKGEV